MGLAKELISVLEKARQTDEYFNPFIIQGVIECITLAHPQASELISDDLQEWATYMYSR